MGSSVGKSTVAEYSTHPSSSKTLGTFALKISRKVSSSDAFTVMDAMTCIMILGGFDEERGKSCME